MITKVVLFDRTIITGVIDVQAAITNINGGLEHSLNFTIGRSADGADPTTESIYEKLTNPGALSHIQVLRKDLIGKTTSPDGIEEDLYSDEYCVQYDKYNTIKTIYRLEDANIVTVTLLASPTDISDTRYNELKKQNELYAIALANLFGKVL